MGAKVGIIAKQAQSFMNTLKFLAWKE